MATPSSLAIGADEGVLATAMCKFVNAALARSTWGKYQSGWRAFCAFEEHTQISSTWPLSRETVRGFTAWCLAHKKLRPNSVRTYLSALAVIHTLKGFPDSPNLKDRLADMMMEGAANLAITDPAITSKRRVVTFPLLRVIGHRIASSAWSEGAKQVVWTACTTAFFTSARLGELLAKRESSFDPSADLLWGQVRFKGSESALIHIRIPKAASDEGDFLDIFQFKESPYCPLAALAKLAKDQKRLGLAQPNMPVFRFPSGKNLTPAKLNKILQELLKDIYQPGSNTISCHSLRAGIPSALRRFPDLASTDDIKGWGRWASDSHNRYTRLREDQRRAIFNKITSVLATPSVGENPCP